MKENRSACLEIHVEYDTRHTSHDTRHTSHVTRHTSHVTRHSSKKEHKVTFILADTLAVPGGDGIEFAQTEHPNEKWNAKL